MAKGTDVVRTARLEVVDRRGRTRVVIGSFTGGDGDTVGLSVLDSHGIERLFIVTDETDASAGVTNAENNVAGLMVNEGEGAYVFVAAPDGTTVRSLDSKASRKRGRSSKK